MKKIIVALMALCLVCACFAGCTPAEEQPSENPTEVAESTAPDATEAPADPTDAPADPTDAPVDPTDAPAKEVDVDPSKFTYAQLSDWTGHDAAFSVDKGDGWQFSGAYELFEFQDGKLIITENEGVIMWRFSLGDGYNQAVATPIKNYDAIAFYFENNSDEECGLSFFGEVYSVATGNCCQLTYQGGKEYSEVTAYLLDNDGNITAGEEYLEDYGHCMTAIPAGFKGYFIVTLDSLGHDYCYYSSYGYHSGCNNGEFVDDSVIAAAGLYLGTYYDEEYSYVVSDYKLVNFGK